MRRVSAVLTAAGTVAVRRRSVGGRLSRGGSATALRLIRPDRDRPRTDLRTDLHRQRLPRRPGATAR